MVYLVLLCMLDQRSMVHKGALRRLITENTTHSHGETIALQGEKGLIDGKKFELKAGVVLYTLKSIM